MRHIKSSDYTGVINVLSQLTTVGTITRAEFTQRCLEMGQQGVTTIVIENTVTGDIVGLGSLYILHKFVHECGKVGLVEDIAIDRAHRGIGLGKALIRRLCETANEKGCYKVMLNCAKENRGFYENCGLKEKEIQMVRYF